MIRSCSCILVLLLISGCARDHERRNGQPPATQPAAEEDIVTLIGTLQGDIAAIGGETTGWRLAGDGEAGGIEVDVSQVQAQAQALQGQRVQITGNIEQRQYVERGTVPVLIAQSIKAAPAPPG